NQGLTAHGDFRWLVTRQRRRLDDLRAFGFVQLATRFRGLISFGLWLRRFRFGGFGRGWCFGFGFVFDGAGLLTRGAEKNESECQAGETGKQQIFNSHRARPISRTAAPTECRELPDHRRLPEGTNRSGTNSRYPDDYYSRRAQRGSDV